MIAIHLFQPETDPSLLFLVTKMLISNISCIVLGYSLVLVLIRLD